VILRGNRLWFCPNLEETSLDEKVPNSAGLVNIDFDEIPGFSSSELAPTSGILTDERLLNDKIWLGQDTEL